MGATGESLGRRLRSSLPLCASRAKSVSLLGARHTVLTHPLAVTLASVKKRLATEDHQTAKRQGPEEEGLTSTMGMTANSFIIEGIDLEESQ
jgi:hypothetical protein